MKVGKKTYLQIVDFILKQKLFYRMIDFFCLPLVPPLYILRRTLRIHMVRIWAGRIGEASSQLEILLRRHRLGSNPKHNKYVMVTSTDVANQYQMDLYKRTFKDKGYPYIILQIPQPKPVRAITKILAQKSVLSRLGLFYVLPTERKEYHEYNSTGPSLSFPEEDEKKGKDFLKQLGVNNAQFICFHARDSTFINTRLRKGDVKSVHRNCDINNYLPAAEYLANQGIFALRMGSLVEKKITSTNQKVIDYATTARSAFGDYYLLGKCKFFLGSTAGICMISQGFNIPLALANHLTLKWPPFRKEDLFIPKKIWSKDKNKFLTFKEIINSPVFEFEWAYEYEDAGLTLVENTPQEIVDLAKEMNDRIDGKWKTTPEDEALQKKFRSLFHKGLPCYGFPARMGSQFLRENKFLLE